MRINKLLNLLHSSKKRKKKKERKKKEIKEICMNKEEMIYSKEFIAIGIFLWIKAEVIFIIQF